MVEDPSETDTEVTSDSMPDLVEEDVADRNLRTQRVRVFLDLFEEGYVPFTPAEHPEILFYLTYAMRPYRESYVDLILDDFQSTCDDSTEMASMDSSDESEWQEDSSYDCNDEGMPTEDTANGHNLCTQCRYSYPRTERNQCSETQGSVTKEMLTQNTTSLITSG